MADLRLGAVHLGAKDIAYIRALVRLFSHTEKLGWAFAEHPPYHAVVADRKGREADPSFFQRFQGLVLTLVEPPGIPEKNTVAYPIHANQFRDWLKARQQDLSSALQGKETPAAVGGGRFKLRRWPAASLLQGDPLHMRIATLMSRNALSVAQLVAVTGQSYAACRRVVAMLHEAGVLVEVAAVADAPAQAAAAPAAAEAAPARRGLMASLRRHLGL